MTAGVCDENSALVALSSGHFHSPMDLASWPECDWLQAASAQKYDVSLYMGCDEVSDCHHLRHTIFSRVSWPFRVNMAIFPTCWYPGYEGVATVESPATTHRHWLCTSPSQILANLAFPVRGDPNVYTDIWSEPERASCVASSNPHNVASAPPLELEDGKMRRASS